MRLLSGPLTNFGVKAEIALREKGVTFALEHVPFDPRSGYTPTHPDVARINPKRQIPVLLDRDVEVYDSTQIFEYLEHRYPSPPLWPEAAGARALARRLEHEADERLFPHVAVLIRRRQGRAVSPDDAVLAQAGIDAVLADLEARLDQGDYLAGDYSYADIATFTALVFAEMMGAQVGGEAVGAWRRRLLARQPVAAAIGPLVRYAGALGLPAPLFMAEQP